MLVAVASHATPNARASGAAVPSVAEGFLAEQHLNPHMSVGQLNDRAVALLDRRVHAVAHRTTKTPPAERLATERPLLLPLPPVGFDTAYRQPRQVHPAIPLISWRGVRYSVPTRALGQTVEVHRPVNSEVFTIRWAGQTIATQHPAPSGADDVVGPRASTPTRSTPR